MKIPDNLKHRIFSEKKAIRQRYISQIIGAMEKEIAIEFTYKNKDSVDSYEIIAPICLKEFEKQWYLLGLHKTNEAFIYALNRIKMIDETGITFSLVQGFSYERFTLKVFDIEKVL